MGKREPLQHRMSRARSISYFICSGLMRAHRFRLARLSGGTLILAERYDHKTIAGTTA
jgi:hypothetical protein